MFHREDDQIVPVKDSADKSALLIKDVQEIYYPGAPHGLTATHQDQFNAGFFAFLGTWLLDRPGVRLMTETMALVVRNRSHLLVASGRSIPRGGRLGLSPGPFRLDAEVVQ